MPSGTLEIEGTLDTSQFWPEGRSDADTAVLTLKAPNKGFTYVHPDGRRTPTRAFVDNKIVGAQGAKPAINIRKKDGRASVSIRLQGIDAPELHFRPTLERGASEAARDAFKACNDELRQPFGETAARALGAFLAKSPTQVPCVFRTVVETPSEAVDVYGRFVGDIFVKRGGREIDVNHWLVENGWAQPAFYNSMSLEEIDAIRSLAAAARKRQGDTVWRRYSATIGQLDKTLAFRRTGDASDDKGKAIVPKIFRRLTVFEAKKCAKLAKGTAIKAMQALTDGVFLLDDFRENGPLSATEVTLGSLIDAHGVLSISPVDLVFKEKGSKLVDENRRTVTKW